MLLTPLTINMNLKCTVKKSLPTYIKSISCIDPDTIKYIFKSFLHIAKSICSKKYIKEEETILMDMFVENGHDKQLLKNLVLEYNKKKNN